MKVRAVDIAEKLGISKATVSLALNGKAGVSPKTRELVEKCKEELEAQFEQVFAAGEESAEAKEPVASSYAGNKGIKILMLDLGLGILMDPLFSVQTGMLRIFESEAKKQGYETGITYLGGDLEEIRRGILECNTPAVAGVILCATELPDEGLEPVLEALRAIQQPLVGYDHDFGSEFHSVGIDNETAAREGVEYLAKRGCRRIEYLSQSVDIHNFVRRREGFCGGLYKMGLEKANCPIVPVGTSIESVTAFLRDWRKDRPLPDAFFTENYQISVALMHVLSENGHRIPEDVSLIGIDEVPPYMLHGFSLTCLSVEHTQRAYQAMELLLGEIHALYFSKVKVASRCCLKKGTTVR